MGIYGDQRLNYVVRPRRSSSYFAWILLLAFFVGVGIFGKLYMDKNPGALDSVFNTLQKQYQALVTSESTASALNKASRFNNEHMLLVKDLRFLVLEMGTYFDDQKHNNYQTTFEEINRSFSSKMDKLQAGGKSMPLLDDKISKELEQIEKGWNGMGNNVRLMLENYPLQKKFSDAVTAIHKISDELVEKNSKLIERLSNSKMAKSQFNLIVKQNFHLQSVKTQSSLLLSSGLDMSSPSERLGEDMTKLSKIYEGLLSGSSAYGVKRLRHKGLRGDVRDIVKILKKLQEQISYVLDISPDIYEIRERRQKIYSERKQLLSDVEKLIRNYGNS